MPKRRTLLLNHPAFSVERVESLMTDAQWSPVYQVASCRWVLPQRGLTEFRWGEHMGLLDGISVLWLPTGVPYQMQQTQQGQPRQRLVGDVDSKIVISLPADFAAAVAAPRMGWLSARVQWQLRRQWRALTRDAPVERAVSSLAVRQFLDMALRAPMMSVPPTMHPCIHGVKCDIARRVGSLDGQRWSLQNVADAQGLSLFYLARLFKAQTGMTLHTYRQQLRLAMALQCLQSDIENLADLAAGLGYSSQSHMGFAFQRELGVTPAQARLALMDS